MSLARTALRLQAIEALLAHPVLDGLLEGRVYDSLISALDSHEPVPVIIVTTEATKRKAIDRQNGGGPYWTTCNLVLEIAMASVEGDGDEAQVGYVATDRAMEAQLDLLEACALEALDGTGPRTPASVALSEFVTRIDPREAETQRFATDEAGLKIATFLVTIEVDLKPPELEDPLEPPTGEFALLPEPLRSVAAGLTTCSSRETCQQLARALCPRDPPAEPATVFGGADLNFAPQSLSAPVTEADALDRGITFAARAAIQE